MPPTFPLPLWFSAPSSKTEHKTTVVCWRMDGWMGCDDLLAGCVGMPGSMDSWELDEVEVMCCLVEVPPFGPGASKVLHNAPSYKASQFERTHTDERVTKRLQSECKSISKCETLRIIYFYQGREAIARCHLIGTPRPEGVFLGSENQPAGGRTSSFRRATTTDSRTSAATCLGGATTYVPPRPGSRP